MLGIWSEEIDALYDKDVNYAVFNKDNPLEMKSTYEARELCDIIHTESAKVLAVYREDFYAGRPALTLNALGNGKAYYIAFRNNKIFLEDFYGKLIKDLNLKKAVETDLPEGVTAQARTDGENTFVFLMNFSSEGKEISLENNSFTDMLTGDMICCKVSLAGYGVKILRSE